MGFEIQGWDITLDLVLAAEVAEEVGLGVVGIVRVAPRMQTRAVCLPPRLALGKKGTKNVGLRVVEVISGGCSGMWR